MSDVSSVELIGHLRTAAASWFNNAQLLMLEELIRRFERAERFKNVSVQSDFDAHDDAMESLGSHNWEPPKRER